ncbi:hypothetical protein PISMIDRAFT_687843, partial [Pisolithus microcarpus 441]
MRENGVGKKRRTSDQRSYNPGFPDVEPGHMMEHAHAVYTTRKGDGTRYENESRPRGT